MSIKKEINKLYNKLMGRRKPPKKYNALYELKLTEIISAEDIKNNSLFVEKMQKENLKQAPKSCLCFLSYADNLQQGGIKTTLLILQAFSKKWNCRNYLCFYPQLTSTQSEQFAEQLKLFFPELKFQICDYNDANLPETDIGLCNFWVTAYPLLKYQKSKRKYYLIQDCENLFYPAGDVSSLAEYTYKFGFYGLTNSSALQENYASYSNTPCFRYFPGVDSNVYFPNLSKKDNKTVRIVFYGRPSSTRNCFFILVDTFRLLKKRLGDKVEIISVGEDYNLEEYRLNSIVKNYGKLSSMQDLGELYRSCDIGVSLISTPTFSYQHLEFMASELCLVTNEQAGIEDFLKNEVNAIISAPLPQILTAKIEELVNNPQKRKSIAKAGAKFAAKHTWNDCLDNICNFIYNKD